MIVRIVKMTFRKGKEKEFLQIFNSAKDKIRNFPGCSHLELLRDIHAPHVYFTYSFWETGKDLLRYRKSELFEFTWEKTKKLFLEEPDAWSLEQCLLSSSTEIHFK